LDIELQSSEGLLPVDIGEALCEDTRPSSSTNVGCWWTVLKRQPEIILGGDAWKMLIPAGLYAIQNNLQYLSVTLVDAATYQVTYQLKILTTAVFAVGMLHKHLSSRQWLSLLMLTVGVALVQLPSDSSPQLKNTDLSQRLQGLIFIVLSCVLSGLAGIYFEKVLKSTKASIWQRNVQMALFSVPQALVFGILFTDGAGIKQNGFFYGYSQYTVQTILYQAVGGLLVSMVVKYADNILKGFATSISIILSCVISIWLFGFQVSAAFAGGAALALYATYLYSV